MKLELRGSAQRSSHPGRRCFGRCRMPRGLPGRSRRTQAPRAALLNVVRQPGALSCERTSSSTTPLGCTTNGRSSRLCSERAVGTGPEFQPSLGLQRGWRGPFCSAPAATGDAEGAVPKLSIISGPNAFYHQQKEKFTNARPKDHAACAFVACQESLNTS